MIRSDGTRTSTADKFTFSADLRELQIRGLGSDNTGAQLVTTVEKEIIKAKKKIKNRVRSIVVDKSTNPSSEIGSTSVNDGLTYGNYPFGTSPR